MHIILLNKTEAGIEWEYLLISIMAEQIAMKSGLTHWIYYLLSGIFIYYLDRYHKSEAAGIY